MKVPSVKLLYAVLREAFWFIARGREVSAGSSGVMIIAR